MSNIENLKRINEQIAKRQQEKEKAYASLAQGLENAFSKKYNLSDVTATAQGILDGKVKPKELGVEWCNDFTEKCRFAIQDLERKKQEYQTSAGLAYMQNRIDSYNKVQKQYEAVDATISLLRTFI
ncbi:MAG: hypothetical protein K0S47_4155 [Herbinix sp.]|jgi:uncharacterized protein YycO|nr:hypothetical protein [Herbinix sp.]